MSLSLKEVFDKVNASPEPSIGYVYDEPIHYVVMNNEGGTISMEEIDKLKKIYADIEMTKGPGVVVMIGTGTRIFGTGFNLPFWASSPLNPIKSLAYNQTLMA